MNFAYGLVIPHDDMLVLSDRTVAGEFCVRLLGPVGLVLASAAVMISVFGALNGNLLVGPRLLYAMAHDGLAPRALGELHSHYRTPAVAETVLAGWVDPACHRLRGARLEFPLPVLALGSWTVDLKPAQGRRAVRHVDRLCDVRRRLVRDPGGRVDLSAALAFSTGTRGGHSIGCWGYPWLPAIYILVMAAVLLNMFVTKRHESLLGLGFVAVGAAVYAWKFGRSGPGAEAKPAPALAAPPAAGE